MAKKTWSYSNVMHHFVCFMLHAYSPTCLYVVAATWAACGVLQYTYAAFTSDRSMVSYSCVYICTVFHLCPSLPFPLLPSPPLPSSSLPSPPGATCLHLATAHGRTTAVEVLLRAGLVRCTPIPCTVHGSSICRYLVYACVPRCASCMPYEDQTSRTTASHVWYNMC